MVKYLSNIIQFVFFFCFCSFQFVYGQNTDSIEPNYGIVAYSDSVQIVKLETGNDDSIAYAMLIVQDVSLDEILKLDTVKKFVIVKLELYDSKVKTLPKAIQEMRELRELVILCPKVRQVSTSYFINLNKLRRLDLHLGVRQYDIAFSNSMNFELLGLWSIRRNAKLLIDTNTITQVNLFLTDVKMTQNNIRTISSLTVSELTVFHLIWYRKQLICFQGIPKISFCGKINKTAKRKVLEILPQAEFQYEFIKKQYHG